MRLKICLGIFVLLALASGAEAANRYAVASGGLSTGTCTVDTPSVTNGQCTITRLLTQLVANDTGLLHAGTYTAANLSFTNAGSAGQYIILKTFGDGSVIINFAGTGNACFNISGSTKHHYKLQDFICDGGNTASDGIDIQVGANNVIIERTIMRNMLGNGYFASANSGAISDITLNDAIAHHCDPNDLSGGLVHGVYFSSGANSLSNVTISGGQFYSNGGRGIQIIDSSFTTRVSNILIERTLITDNNDGIVTEFYNGLTQRNNLVYKNNKASGHGSHGGIKLYGGAGTTNIYNNTILSNNGSGSSSLPGLSIAGNVPTPLNVKNNIVQSNGGGNCVAEAPVTCADAGFSNNAFGGAGVAFANASIDDYHLASGDVVALNQGTTISSFSNDLDNQTRPQGSAWDIGCYELVLNPPPPPGPPWHSGRLKHRGKL